MNMYEYNNMPDWQ